MSETTTEPAQSAPCVQAGTRVQDGRVEDLPYCINRAAAALGVAPEFLAAVLAREGLLVNNQPRRADGWE